MENEGDAITLANEFMELDYALMSNMQLVCLASDFSVLQDRTPINYRLLFIFCKNQLSYPWSINDRDLQKNLTDIMAL